MTVNKYKQCKRNGMKLLWRFKFFIFLLRRNTSCKGADRSSSPSRRQNGRQATGGSRIGVRIHRPIDITALHWGLESTIDLSINKRQLY